MKVLRSDSRLSGIEKQPFYYQGLHFSCLRCSACCRYESGYVFLSKTDLDLLVSRLQMEYTEFMEAYCRWVPSGGGIERLSLKEKSDYASRAAQAAGNSRPCGKVQSFDCIFWGSPGGQVSSSSEGCGVYEARPLQCRAFPFWPSVLRSPDGWKEMARDCPGMGKGAFHSGQEIASWLEKQDAAPVIRQDRSGSRGGN
jgi:Fe-S-cluster containining protein